MEIIKRNKSKRKVTISNDFIREILDTKDELIEKSTGLGTDLRALLDSKNDLIPLDEEYEELRYGNLTNIIGKDKDTRLDLAQILQVNLAEASKRMGNYIRSPISVRLQEAMENEWILQEMPSLRKSANYFIDDVVSGETWGQSSISERFDVRGIDDDANDNIKTKIKEVLSGETEKAILNGLGSATDIQREAAFKAWCNGYSIVAIYSHRMIAQELYSKYVLFTAKNKVSKEARLQKTLTSQEAANFRLALEHAEGGKDNLEMKPIIITLTSEAINLLNQELGKKEVARRGIIKDTNIVGKIDEFTLNLLPDEMKNIEYGLFTKTVSGENAEEFSSVSFREFVKLYTTDKVGLKGFVSAESPYLTPNPYPRDIKIDFDSILNKLEQNSIAPAAITISAEAMANNFNETQKNALKMMDMYTLLSNELYTFDGTDIVPNTKLSSEMMFLRKPLENIHIAFENIVIGLHEKLILSAESVMDFLPQMRKEDMIKEVRQNKGTDKMFANLLGETHMVLDTPRCVPVMVNNELEGCLHLDFTDEDMQVLAAARNLATVQMLTSAGPRSARAVEDDVARFAMQDVVINTIKENLSKNFIRNNGDVLYAIKKILDEHEYLLQNSRDNVEQNFNGFLSTAKIRYIPGSNLVLFRSNKDTNNPLGRSMVQETKPYSTNYILLNDSFTSWYTNEGKGAMVFTFNKGLTTDGAKAARRVLPMIKNLTTYRSQQREPGRFDQAIGRKIILQMLSSPEDGFKYEAINPSSDFEPDKEFLEMQELKATDIIGYPSSLFNELNSQTTATKIIAQEGTKILDTINMQKAILAPSSRLMTLISRYNTGYKNTVIWLPPIPSKLNTDIKRELLNATIDTYKLLTEELETLYEDKDKNVLLGIRKNIFLKLFGNIPELSTLKELEKDIEIDALIEAAKEITKKKKKNSAEDEDDNME